MDPWESTPTWSIAAKWRAGIEPARALVPKLARPEDADAFASVSHAAKLSYREWARPGWKAPSQAAEMTRWKQRLADDAGWGLLARDLVRAIGTIHFTDARTDGGAGEAIPGRAHLSGLFVLPARWGEGIGSALLARAVEEMRSRSYRSAQLFTAVDNAALGASTRAGGGT
jgi:GNAT superfamily N-acetyltransferase